MKQTSRIISYILILCLSVSLTARGQMRGRILSGSSKEPVPGVAVTAQGVWAISDSTGFFIIKADEGTPAVLTCLGYKTARVTLTPNGTYILDDDYFSINEVVITAVENRGVTSVSRIGEDAIAHIQPSSIADVLELLPGGRSRDPVLSSPQIVNLRAAGSLSSDYTTSSLGTRFMIDGRMVGTDANLQYSPTYSSLGSEFVNLGTDMRTIPTEDIENIEVIRGIASVEYGDLTSGLFKIERRKGGNDIRARFKSDMNSKLFYVSKGLEWGGKDKATLNAGFSFLDSKADPRNPRQNYKRLSGSIRAGKTWTEGRDFKSSVFLNLDYTGSIDNQKSDENVDLVDGRPAETYKSSYHDFSLSADYSLSAKEEDGFFRSLTVLSSLTYEKDLIDRWKNVVRSSEAPISVSREPGEYDAVMVPARYEATMQVDGQPFYASFSATARFRKGVNDMKAGLQWNMEKNYGKGSVFDVERPLSTSSSSRPRPYSAIPASHELSLFAEESGKAPVGKCSFEWLLGVRATAMFNVGKEYSINSHPYFDPRANLRLNLPTLVPRGYKLEWGVYGGAGFHTKFPTMDMLHPDYIFGDQIQLNYWPAEKDLRRINLLVYRLNPVPYGLGAARNIKWELGIDADWNGWSLSADWFIEDMKSGFRDSYAYERIVRKDYDEGSIDKSVLSGPPSLDGLPYVLDTSLVAYGVTSNGSRTLKQGVEYSITSKRIPGINTRVTLSGAWFLTRHMNSQPEYYRPSVVINGKTYPYIGIYERNDGRLYESANTNVMFDTQVPRLGLVVSTSLQALWFTGSKSMPNDTRPTSYLDKDLVVHEYTLQMESDPVLRHLVRDYTASLYQYQRVPFAMDVNLKVTKSLYNEKVRCAVFVNRIFDVTPDYYRNDVIVRRNAVPYFGMEISFKL